MRRMICKREERFWRKTWAYVDVCEHRRDELLMNTHNQETVICLPEETVMLFQEATVIYLQEETMMLFQEETVICLQEETVTLCQEEIVISNSSFTSKYSFPQNFYQLISDKILRNWVGHRCSGQIGAFVTEILA